MTNKKTPEREKFSQREFFKFLPYFPYVHTRRQTDGNRKSSSAEFIAPQQLISAVCVVSGKPAKYVLAFLSDARSSSSPLYIMVFHPLRVAVVHIFIEHQRIQAAEPHKRIHDARKTAHIAEQRSDKVKSEKAYKPPVYRSDDNKRQNDVI